MNHKLSFFTAAIILLVLVYSCGSEGGHGSAPQAAVALPTDFIQLKTDDADISYGYPGTIEGQNNVDVKAQVTGYLEAVYVKEGQYVNKGQTLFRINPSVYNQQANNSNAALNVAIANQATSRLEVEKLRPLVEGKVISEMQLKTAQANYEAASAQVTQAKSALGSSQITAGFTYIKAPVSGYIGRIPNRVGNLIAPGDTAALTTLSNINNVNVYFSMNEADFLTYSKSSKSNSGNVELILADGSTYSYKGTLENASGSFDRTMGSIQMKAVFNNPDKLLRSGGTGKVLIHQYVEGVVKLPKTAVKDIQDKFFVYKLGAKNKVVMSPVEISGGNTNDYFVSGGVKAGDKIAINRIDGLADGAEVVPMVIPVQ